MECSAKQCKSCIDSAQNKNDIRLTLQKQGHLSFYAPTAVTESSLFTSLLFFFYLFSIFLNYSSTDVINKRSQCSPINLHILITPNRDLFRLLDPINIYDVRFVCIPLYTLCCVRAFETIIFYAFLKGRVMLLHTVFLVS